MRHQPSEKRGIIELAECSSLPVRRALHQLGIPKSTFYRCYQRYRERRFHFCASAQFFVQ